MFKTFLNLAKKINVRTFSKVCEPYKKLRRMVDLERSPLINPLLQHEKFVKTN